MLPRDSFISYWQHERVCVFLESAFLPSALSPRLVRGDHAYMQRRDDPTSSYSQSTLTSFCTYVPQGFSGGLLDVLQFHVWAPLVCVHRRARGTSVRVCLYVRRVQNFFSLSCPCGCTETLPPARLPNPNPTSFHVRKFTHILSARGSLPRPVVLPRWWRCRRRLRRPSGSRRGAQGRDPHGWWCRQKGYRTGIEKKGKHELRDIFGVHQLVRSRRGALSRLPFFLWGNVC